MIVVYAQHSSILSFFFVLFLVFEKKTLALRKDMEYIYVITTANTRFHFHLLCDSHGGEHLGFMPG